MLLYYGLRYQMDSQKDYQSVLSDSFHAKIVAVGNLFIYLIVYVKP